MTLRSSAGRSKIVSFLGLGGIVGGFGSATIAGTLFRLDSSSCLLLRLMFLNMVARSFSGAASAMYDK